MIPKSEVLIKAPSLQGIYFLYSKRGKLVYVGRSYNILDRLKQHLRNIDKANHYMKRKGLLLPYGIEFAKPFEFFRFTLVKDKKELYKMEKELIRCLKPPYNEITMFNKAEIIDWRYLLY